MLADLVKFFLPRKWTFAEKHAIAARGNFLSTETELTFVAG